MPHVQRDRYYEACYAADAPPMMPLPIGGATEGRTDYPNDCTDDCHVLVHDKAKGLLW